MLPVQKRLFLLPHTRKMLPEAPLRHPGPRFERPALLGALRTGRHAFDALELLIELPELGAHVVNDRGPNRQLANRRSHRLLNTPDLLVLLAAVDRRSAMRSRHV
jgi:hypothetical protein